MSQDQRIFWPWFPNSRKLSSCLKASSETSTPGLKLMSMRDKLPRGANSSGPSFFTWLRETYNFVSPSTAWNWIGSDSTVIKLSLWPWKHESGAAGSCLSSSPKHEASGKVQKRTLDRGKTTSSGKCSTSPKRACPWRCPWGCSRYCYGKGHILWSKQAGLVVESRAIFDQCTKISMKNTQNHNSKNF